MLSGKRILDKTIANKRYSYYASKNTRGEATVLASKLKMTTKILPRTIYEVWILRS